DRKKQLVKDAGAILNKIRELNSSLIHEDPLINPGILAKAVGIGILDAPHLCGVKAARGAIMTMFRDGKNITVDRDLRPITEMERLEGLIV
ncbi:MAG: methionine synthase, partial [Actinobacteria bacterium]|nr:methionine synthase [Actinomycetota bacterium]